MEVKARWLKNNGLDVAVRRPGGVWVWRFVGPKGDVSILEAAAALGTYQEKIRRLVVMKRVATLPKLGPRRIPMTELLRLRRAKKALGGISLRTERRVLESVA